jgi:nicotinate phosphoribosyltransferase
VKAPAPASLSALYRPSLGLLTDLYQLTMAYAHHRRGTHEQRAVFHLSFRKNPFQGGYTVAAGLQQAIELIEDLRFAEEDVAYLATLSGNDGAPLFSPAFLEYLAQLRFQGDVDAVPEGTVMFPHAPLLRVTAPIAIGQLLETPLLTILNFQSLVATKASRVCAAAGGDPVLEFGLRRAQGVDGGLSASRAAYVGGVSATSNVLAGRLYGIPVRGTHAHSWIMAMGDELEAFRAYAEALPNNCTFLVDTYETLQGVRHAITVGQELRARGHRLAGIRLDSGDLAYLSREARVLLDEAGFTDAVIVASNDLDEHLVASLKAQGAQIGVWGVGTKLVTAYDQPALGGVYKLTAIEGPDGRWIPRVKLSEQAIKVSNPGVLQVRRHRHEGRLVGDAIWDETLGTDSPLRIVDPLDPNREKVMPAEAEAEELLVPIFRAGRRVYDPPPLPELRARTQRSVAELHPGITRFLNPHSFPIGLERRLHVEKTALIRRARGLEP